jgi:hypothetical protein
LDLKPGFWEQLHSLSKQQKAEKYPAGSRFLFDFHSSHTQVFEVIRARAEEEIIALVALS